MLLPTHKRKDLTVPVYTLVFDSTPTEDDQKYFCEICKGTTLRYWGNLAYKFDFDVYRNPTEESKKFVESKTPPFQIECTHFIQRPNSYRTRCRTFYMIFRMAYQIKNFKETFEVA